MKATIKVSKNTIIEVEAETQKDLFQQIASAHEVFGEKKCGLCGCEDITPAWRNVTQGKKEYDYPEYHCTKCFARLSLGTTLTGGILFPIRKLVEKGPEAGKPSRESGEYGDHKGWTKFKGLKKDEAAE